MGEGSRILSEVFFNLIYLAIVIVLIVKMVSCFLRVSSENRKATGYLLPLDRNIDGRVFYFFTSQRILYPCFTASGLADDTQNSDLYCEGVPGFFCAFS